MSRHYRWYRSRSDSDNVCQDVQNCDRSVDIKTIPW